MAHTVTQNGCPHTGGTVTVKILGVSRLHDLEIHGEVPHVDTSIRARDIFQTSPGTLEAFVYNLQQFSLLRVHVGRFEVVDPEEGVLKVPDILLEEISALCVHASRPLFVGMIEGFGIKSRGRDIALSCPTIDEHVPELI